MRSATLASVLLVTCIAFAIAEEPYWHPPISAEGPAPAGAYAFALKPDSGACGQCHARTHAEWRSSLHAQAFSPGLSGQLPAFTAADQAECLRCHAPRSEQQANWFAGKRSVAIDGVDCSSCHIRNGIRVGPRAVKSTPHGSVQAHPLFKRSEFCASCHQFGPDGLTLAGKPIENTYEEWKASRYARENITCQNCHMPDGRHEFRGIHDPDMTRKALAVRTLRFRNGIRVVARNEGAGHHLPTYTTPLIRIDIRGGNRQREHLIRRALAWDARTGLREISDTRLPAGSSVSIELELPPHVPGEILVTVDPGYDYHMRIFPDLLASLGSKLSQADRGRLQSARTSAGERVYVLYRFRCDAWRYRDSDCAPIP